MNTENQLQAILTYSSNTGIFDGYGNRLGALHLGHCAYWSGPYGMNDVFHTSSIASYEINGAILSLNTLNSVYVFEIKQGELDLDSIVLAEQSIIEEYQRRNATKYLIYWCQVNASGFLSGLIDPVQMPYPMNKQEAIEYVSLGKAVSFNGHIARIVLAPHIAQEENNG